MNIEPVAIYFVEYSYYDDANFLVERNADEGVYYRNRDDALVALARHQAQERRIFELKEAKNWAAYQSRLAERMTNEYVGRVFPSPTMKGYEPGEFQSDYCVAEAELL